MASRSPDSPAPAPASDPLSSDRIVTHFDATFLKTHDTVLRGGFDEPLYVPFNDGRPAEIRFRSDYASSALHEVAHWTVAGKERRKQVDYGYWYRPDGRTDEEQLEFFRVESRPQAIEWCLSLVAKIRFRISLDNVGSMISTPSFERAVRERFHDVTTNPPARMRLFADALNGGSSVNFTALYESHRADPIW